MWKHTCKMHKCGTFAKNLQHITCNKYNLSKLKTVVCLSNVHWYIIEVEEFSLLLCIYLEINTNYVSPWRGPIYPWRGPEFPLVGTGTPPGGLVRSFPYMQLYLTLCLTLFEGLVDELLSINPSPQVNTGIIG